MRLYVFNESYPLVVKKLETIFLTAVTPGAMLVSPASFWVLKRIVYRKSCRRGRRQKRGIGCNKHQSNQLLRCDCLTHGEGARQVQRIVSP
jgi:hypothetical protein